jgi:hypothetical protein
MSWISFTLWYFNYIIHEQMTSSLDVRITSEEEK